MDQGSVLVVTRIQVEFKIQPEVVPLFNTHKWFK